MDKPITIFSDSQAALRALESWDVNSKTVRECIEALNDLGTKTRVDLKWIKAHVGHEGNERADSLAKLGAADRTPSCEPNFPVPKATTTKLINNYLSEEWDMEWKALPKCRQTRYWFPERDRGKSKRLVGLGRDAFSKALRWLTGHCFLRRHRSICQENDEYISPTCRLCREEDETPIHITADCPALHRSRMEIFGERFMPVDEPPDWSVDQLQALLSLDGVYSLEEEEDE